MLLKIRYFSFFILLLSLTVQGLQVVGSDGAIGHLEKYLTHNENHHDNIAETEHSHTHKHSEEGEEHEHQHEHQSSTQGSFNLLSNKSFKLINISMEEQSHNFLIKLMISSDHPCSIFRPPIS